MSRYNRNPLPTELKDRYFFIDYFRLHRFGKEHGIWKKNRNMLVKEHEYSRDYGVQSRKGYKSYIQRCMKSILDWLYPEWGVSKPRNRFAYEIGKKGNRRTELIDPNSNEDKVKLVIQRYLMNNSFAPLVEGYKAAVNQSTRLRFRNNQTGLYVDLDGERSLGYEALKQIIAVKSFQDAMVAKFDSGEVVKSIMADAINKMAKLPIGTIVEQADASTGQSLGAHTQARITRIDNRMDYNYREVLYVIEQSNGISSTHYREGLTIVALPGTMPLATQPVVESTVEVTVEPLVERIVEYALEHFAETTGVNSDAIFRLARAAVVRQTQSIPEATELRQIEPTSAILERIAGSHDIVSEDEYDEHDEDDDTEYCQECGYEEDNCMCCAECGMESCECDELEDLAL